jgi:hypothetical protein
MPASLTSTKSGAFPSLGRGLLFVEIRHYASCTAESVVHSGVDKIRPFLLKPHWQATEVYDGRAERNMPCHRSDSAIPARIEVLNHFPILLNSCHYSL